MPWRESGELMEGGANMRELASINGEILPISEAAISIEDRGYQLGDGIYEVILSYQGELFKQREHLERMERSAERIRLRMRYSIEEIESMCDELMKESGIEEALLYVQLTRGVYPRQHNIPSSYDPVLVITVREKPAPLEEAKVITTEDLRWKLCSVKSTNLLPNVLAREEASLAGCEEPLFVREGRLMEGATTNVFLVQGDTFVTPVANNLILEGITRNVVLEILEEMGCTVQERDIDVQEVFTAHEVFLTGTVTEVTAVLEVDGVKIKDGRPGEYTRRILKEYRQLT